MTVRVWNTHSGQLVYTFVLGGVGWLKSADQVEFSRDGKTIFTVANDLRAYNLESGELKWLRRSNRFPSFLLSPNGRFAAIHETWWLSRPRVKRILRSLSEEEVAVFEPDAPQTRLRLLDLDSNKFLTTRFPGDRPSSFSEDSAFIRLERGLDSDEEDLIVEIATGERVSNDAFKTFGDPDSMGRAQALIPETSYIIKTDFHRFCQVVDSNDETFLREIDPGPSYDVCARGSQSGTQFAIGDDSGAIRFVSTSTWRVERVIPGTCEVSDIAVSSDSKYLAAVCRPTCHGPFKVVLWDLEKLIMLGDMEYETGAFSWILRINELTAYTYDHNLRWLGKVGSSEHRLYQKAQRLRLDDNQQVVQVERILAFYRKPGIESGYLMSHRCYMPEQDRSLSHNGKWLAITQPDRALVIDVDHGSDVDELPSGLVKPDELFLSGRPVATSVSEDGRLVAVGHSMVQDIDIVLFDFVRKRVTAGYRVNGDTYDSLAFHPMNTYLAVGDAYLSPIQLVDLRRKRRNKVIVGHAGAIQSLEFCPNGSHLISASSDGQIILWDAETFERQATLMAFPQSEDLYQPFRWTAHNSKGMVNGSPAVEQLFV